MSKPKNSPWLSPYLIVSDVDKAVEFYQKVFNFTLVDAFKGEDGTGAHAEMLHQKQMFMIGKADAATESAQSPAMSNIACPIILYAYVEDVDNFYDHAISCGATSKQAA